MDENDDNTDIDDGEVKLVNDYIYSLFSNGKIPFETHFDKIKEIKNAIENGTSIIDVRT